MAIYARLENGTYAEVTGVYKTDGTEVTEIFQSDRLVYSATNEIYGAVPLYYDGLGYELIDYLISGNAVQDGTPSADAPVDAQGSGVRTGNLFDYTKYVGTSMANAGLWEYSGTDATILRIPCTENTLYTLSLIGTFNLSVYRIATANTSSTPAPNSQISVTDIVRRGSGIDSYSFTTPAGAKYILFQVNALSAEKVAHAAMLNLGSTALPYEPYGFKLPLTVNGTEYPIYLGQVESTRRVKKLVLTGKENWRVQYDGYTLSIRKKNGLTLCTHYMPSISTKIDKSIYMASTNVIIIYDSDYTTFDDFIAFLAAQYANGTPVTVWYVLAEPETGIVNEPLMKIGDYADTVSFAQAGVTIPTVNGANVLDMTSPVKPSEVCIKGKGIKPTGYGQLADVNGVNILDKDGRPIYVHGQ